ncbi:MAG: hypothetical protein E4H01_03725 [Lysobacterales bacterium]|nr:MAG: hypothetical protein E4H01_03725 [Xanthomonadales bacterium]
MGEPIRFTDNVLRCPICEFNCTSHYATTVYERDSEDSEFGFVTRCEHGETHTVARKNFLGSINMRANPSSRRDGLSIEFECERCDGFILHFAQHKGETIVTVDAI